MKRNLMAGVLLATVGLLGGCLPEKRIAWSPDGRWGTVRAGDGFYICDVSGRVSPRLAEEVAAAAWLPDSRHLVLSVGTKVKTWEELTKSLPVERVSALEKLGEQLQADALAYEGDWDQFKPASIEGQTGGTGGALLLYLHDKANPTLRAKLGDRWESTQDLSITIWRLRVGEWSDGALELSTTLMTSLDAATEPRVSPDGTHVAFTLPMPGENAPMELYVAPLTGAAAPVLVAERAARFADWSPDGRRVVYAAANAGSGDKDSLRLGVVARRQVCDEQGSLLDPRPEAEDLAGIAFEREARVRCLRDGRIIFASAEIHLPSTTKDMPQRTGLFAVDPDRQPTVTRLIPRQSEGELPDAVFLFEVSPDERHVALPSGNGEVAVLTLATGDIWQLHADADADELRTLPTWRSSDELCFSFGPKPDEAGAHAEIVLAKLDWEARTVHRNVLSGGWPAGVVDEFLAKTPDQVPATQP